MTAVAALLKAALEIDAQAQTNELREAVRKYRAQEITEAQFATLVCEIVERPR